MRLKCAKAHVKCNLFQVELKLDPKLFPTAHSVVDISPLRAISTLELPSIVSVHSQSLSHLQERKLAQLQIYRFPSEDGKLF